MNETLLSNILLILLALCFMYVLHLKIKLDTALYSLDKWREMIVFFNGKRRLSDK